MRALSVDEISQVSGGQDNYPELRVWLSARQWQTAYQVFGDEYQGNGFVVLAMGNNQFVFIAETEGHFDFIENGVQDSEEVTIPEGQHAGDINALAYGGQPNGNGQFSYNNATFAIVDRWTPH